MGMLSNCKLIAFLPTEDFSRAKKFYQETLGLTLLSEDPFALVFDARGQMLRIAKVKERVAVPYTKQNEAAIWYARAERGWLGSKIQMGTFYRFPSTEAASDRVIPVTGFFVV